MERREERGEEKREEKREEREERREEREERREKREERRCAMHLWVLPVQRPAALRRSPSGAVEVVDFSHKMGKCVRNSQKFWPVIWWSLLIRWPCHTLVSIIDQMAMSYPCLIREEKRGEEKREKRGERREKREERREKMRHAPMSTTSTEACSPPQEPERSGKEDVVFSHKMGKCVRNFQKFWPVIWWSLLITWPCPTLVSPYHYYD